MDGGRGELTGERFEGADGLLGNGERVSLAGEDAGEDGLWTRQNLAQVALNARAT